MTLNMIIAPCCGANAPWNPNLFSKNYNIIFKIFLHLYCSIKTFWSLRPHDSIDNLCAPLIWSIGIKCREILKNLVTFTWYWRKLEENAASDDVFDTLISSSGRAESGLHVNAPWSDIFLKKLYWFFSWIFFIYILFFYFTCIILWR